MSERPVCPLCGKRRPERFCPAKGEKICAVCCGTEREVTLDCPADCGYLIAAHRYEEEHRKPLPESEVPFPDVNVSESFLYERQPALAGLAYTVLTFAAMRRELADRDVFEALSALAETYRTLTAGIYYEKSPGAPLAAGLYAAFQEFLQEYRKRESERFGYPVVKDLEVFHLLVFFARMARGWTNGRPRARIFLEFLRRQFPKGEELQPAAPRIIAPDAAPGLILPGPRG